VEKMERDGEDGASWGGEADGVWRVFRGLSRLERFDRMQKIKSMRSRVSREDYAAHLRGFGRPVGVASSRRLQEARVYMHPLRRRPVRFMAAWRTLRQPGFASRIQI
jgi:hypothetical protein